MSTLEDYKRKSCTALDLFENDYNLKILTIKVQCPVCGHGWGIRIDDYKQSLDIPDKKFKCGNCNNK